MKAPLALALSAQEAVDEVTRAWATEQGQLPGGAANAGGNARPEPDAGFRRRLDLWRARAGLPPLWP